MVRLDTSCLTSSVAVDARVGAVVERLPTQSTRIPRRPWSVHRHRPGRVGVSVDPPRIGSANTPRRLRSMPGRFGSVLLALLFASTAASACDDRSSVPSLDEIEGTPASDRAIASDEEMRVAPGGYLDCGSVNLTSGWPTTTALNIEVQGECITEAAASGEPAQQGFSGRDNEGGIVGSIVRVSGAEDITVIGHHIDAEGVVTSSEAMCAGLDTSGIGPPTCLE